MNGREMWSRTLSDERRLGAFENRVLRGIFVPKRDEDYTKRSLMICTPQDMSFG